jgi:drug/metabolite transporter (DMT)-like permease
MLLSAVTIAFYYVWSAELVEQYGTLPVATWNLLAGFLAILPLAFWEASHSSFEITARALGVAAYLGIGVTAAGLLLWLYLLRVVPARIAASVQYLQPVFGIAASAALFGDALGAPFVVGVVVILGGLVLTIGNDGAES